MVLQKTAWPHTGIAQAVPTRKQAPDMDHRQCVICRSPPRCVIIQFKNTNSVNHFDRHYGHPNGRAPTMSALRWAD